MTTTDAEAYRSLARTLRSQSRTYYQNAATAEERGMGAFANAQRVLARGSARAARRWDALAELGQT